MKILVTVKQNDGMAEAPPAEYEVSTPEHLLFILAEEWGDPPAVGSTIELERVG